MGHRPPSGVCPPSRVPHSARPPLVPGQVARPHLPTAPPTSRHPNLSPPPNPNPSPPPPNNSPPASTLPHDLTCLFASSSCFPSFPFSFSAQTYIFRSFFTHIFPLRCYNNLILRHIHPEHFIFDVFRGISFSHLILSPFFIYFCPYFIYFFPLGSSQLLFLAVALSFLLLPFPLPSLSTSIFQFFIDILVYARFTNPGKWKVFLPKAFYWSFIFFSYLAWYHHGILKLRQCMQHFSFLLRVLYWSNKLFLIIQFILSCRFFRLHCKHQIFNILQYFEYISDFFWLGVCILNGNERIN